jgi:solute carrier family 10 (sodium/bile acid cotransporter), member 7
MPSHRSHLHPITKQDPTMGLLRKLTPVSLILPFLLADHLNAFTSASFSARRQRHALLNVIPPLFLQNGGCGDKFLLLRGGHNVRDKQKRRRNQRQQPVESGSLPSSALLAASGDVTSSSPRLANVSAFCNKNFFLLGMFVAIGLARAFPALGKNGGMLRPELFIGKFGVMLIFLLSGLSLELSQLGKAAFNHKLNALIQLVTFAAWPLLVGLPLKYVFSTLLPNAFSPALLDGLLILSCLPTTINMCVILTSSAGGSTAAALWNAIISNVGGIFVTPALLFRFFGTSIQLPFVAMLLKLSSMVLAPVIVGQGLRLTPLKQVSKTHAKTLKRLQEVLLLSILWNAFCTAFSNGIGLSLRDAASLLTLLSLGHVASLAVLFALFSLPALKFSRKQVVAAMFCSSHKTLAFGLPLVNTVFVGNVNLAAYCAPIMVIHPLQLVLGSLLIPRLEKYTCTEKDESSD